MAPHFPQADPGTLFVFSGIAMAIVTALLVAVSWSRWDVTPTETPIGAGEAALAVRSG